jgi:hypothetical protein
MRKLVIDKHVSPSGGNGYLFGALELTRISHSENTCLMIHVPRIDDPDVKYKN